MTKWLRERVTSDIKAVVDATVDGAEGATSNGRLDGEFRGVDLPLFPLFLHNLCGGSGGGDKVKTIIIST